MTVPLTELESRLTKVQAGLKGEGIDAALIIQTADLYYLTGTAQQSHLLLPAAGEPLLLVRRDPARARAESALARVESFASFRELPAALARIGLAGACRLGLELDVLPVVHLRRYEQLFQEAELVDCSSILRETRSVKSPWEVERLREAGLQSEAAFVAAAGALREGMTEAELASVIMATLVREGHPGLLRMRGFNQEMPLAHVFAGPDAGVASYADAPFGGRGRTPAVPQGASDRTIGRGEAVVIDIGGSVAGYIVDQTRTLCLGALPEDLSRAYQTCRAIHHEVMEAARPGASCAQLYDLAVGRATEAGYQDTFMGTAPTQVTFLGHGIGLEVDELPILGRGWDRPLVPGNVIAIEPKIRFAELGAVGVEDTCLVTEDGLDPITSGDDDVWEL
jgi:Xaa-Pro dipeptidase